jgi:hypothetical protein
MSPSYHAYINGAEWRRRRDAKLSELGHRCQGCDETERLEVHHLTYDRLGRERMEDLMVLCHLCHAREHGRSPHGGETAGPGYQELTRRVREREDLEGRQALILGVSEILHHHERLLDLIDHPGASRLFRSNVRAFRRLLRRAGDDAL